MSQPTRRKNTTKKPSVRKKTTISGNAKKAKSRKITSSSIPQKSVSTPVAKKTSKKQPPLTSSVFSKKKKNKMPKATASLSDSSMLWTKKGKKSDSSSFLRRFFAGIGSFFAFIGKILYFAFRTLIAWLASLINRSKIAFVALLVLIVVLGVGIVDYGINWGKVYPGIRVGSLDLGGKSAEEAQKLIEDSYSARLTDAKVYIFANEEASHDLDAALAKTQDEAFAEQQSVEEVQAQKLVWETDAASLGATIDTRGLVGDALAFGREEGGILNRLSALLSGHEIEPRAHYNEEAIEGLAQDIDASIGEARVNYDVHVIESKAIVEEGHDGNMINRETFTSELDKALLTSNEATPSFVAYTEYAPLQITEEIAEKTCDRINASIIYGAEFVYGDTVWTANATEVGDWVQTRIEETENGWELIAYLDYDLAKNTLINHLRANFEDNEVKVWFSVENGETTVHSDTRGTIPQSQEAIAGLNALLFEGDIPNSTPSVTVNAVTIPKTLSLEKALDSGVVTKVSEYTTEYTANVTNRNHNIHLAADLLNLSIVPADGGVWSFNDTAGNCNEEAGFKGAGSIIDGEYVDEIGGGICQVATTVFNAVYNAGYPVVQRHNHSLYIASYPAGRDAAVSWPDLDLKWKNDTTSDVLLLTSYTESSLTISLYGIDPEYQVSTEIGAWEEGEKYKTQTLTDDTLAPGYSYVKTHGTNGSSITIVRTVLDAEGAILHEDLFRSVYEAKNEVKVEGPKIEEPKTDDSSESSESGTSENDASNTL